MQNPYSIFFLINFFICYCYSISIAAHFTTNLRLIGKKIVYLIIYVLKIIFSRGQFQHIRFFIILHVELMKRESKMSDTVW